MTIGERIKQARTARGFTQKQLGAISETSEITVRQYELGKRQPRLEQLQAIAAALEVDINWLMNGQTLEQRDQAMKDHVARRFAEAEAGLRKKRREQLNAAFDLLNQDGQGKAVERVEELTEIPKYQRTTTTQSTPAPPEGKDTAKPSDAPQRPQESEEKAPEQRPGAKEEI